MVNNKNLIGIVNSLLEGHVSIGMIMELIFVLLIIATLMMKLCH